VLQKCIHNRIGIARIARPLIHLTHTPKDSRTISLRGLFSCLLHLH
jgi:hypothetical protein